jgi:acyl carrier protein
MHNLDQVQDLEHRLARCFSSVFPELSEEQIRNASIESVPGWHSLASVTLFSLVQEEFGVQVNLGDLPNLVSFSAVHNYVQHHLAS